jgi:excisionase family DNA binding protein
LEHFMTSEEIADLLHVDPVTIRRLVNKGELSAYRIGADYRFAPSDLQDYLQRQHIPARAQSRESKHSFDYVAQFLSVVGRKYSRPADIERFDRFTKRARHVLSLAQEEAQRLQHNYIGTEHLLLGLTREGEGIAGQVLSKLGIEAEQIRTSVEAIIGHGERVVPVGSMPLTPRTKEVIELAVDEAKRLKHRFVGTEHLLLGLIREGEGVAAKILESLGLQLEQVRTETLQVLQLHEQEEIAAAKSSSLEEMLPLLDVMPGLICPTCKTRSPDFFRYCYHCGQSLAPEEKSDPATS